MSRILSLQTTAAQLHKKPSFLEQEYIAASKDKTRLKDLEDWNVLDSEGWDEYGVTSDINKPTI